MSKSCLEKIGLNFLLTFAPSVGSIFPTVIRPKAVRGLWLRGRIHGEISALAEISARLLGDGKEGGNVLNKKDEVWNTESDLWRAIEK